MGHRIDVFIIYNELVDIHLQEGRFVRMLMDVGLDPEDRHESESDPIGIGNLCGRKINEYRDNDGMNSKGDIITGRQQTRYNHEPYSDYTGYQVVTSYIYEYVSIYISRSQKIIYTLKHSYL